MCIVLIVPHQLEFELGMIRGLRPQEGEFWLIILEGKTLYG